MSQKNFYITTPIYYVNAEPHLGHAFTTTVADVLTRFHRLDGYDAFFLTGTDEHGDKLMEACRENGEDPKAFVDKMSRAFRETWPRIQAEPNRFIRTTEPEHIAVVQKILQRVYDSGDIYFGEYGGYYCQGCERFVLERELVDGKCPQHDTEPKYISEQNYFFKMSNYQDWLVDHIKSNPGFIRPERYANEILAFLKDPLEDLCISRPRSRLDWGITLPFDEDYVCYVWFDALINYLTGVDWPDGENYQKFWPQVWHLTAKDIIKPHGIYWPTMLKAAGIPVYQHLNVHGYWTVDGGKMSKSKGNVIKPLDLIDKYGSDAFRYFLMREMSFGLDASFSEQALVNRMNGDLANDLGNLFSRVTAMIIRYNDGAVNPGGGAGQMEHDLDLLSLTTAQEYTAQMRELAFHKALKAVWDYINALNKYIVANEPWQLAKSEDDKPRLNRVLYTLAVGLLRTAYMIWPIMPGKADEIAHRLGHSINIDPEGIVSAVSKVTAQGLHAAKGEALFPRVELKLDGDEAAKAVKPTKKKDKKKPKKAAAEPADQVIEYDDFAKVHLRVGKVLKAEKPEESKKLLVLTVDLGEAEPRQILAGLAKFYQPEEVIGRLVVVAANLKPRKMMGLVSHGMILATDSEDDVRLLDPPAGAQPGAVVR